MHKMLFLELLLFEHAKPMKAQMHSLIHDYYYSLCYQAQPFLQALYSSCLLEGERREILGTRFHIVLNFVHGCNNCTLYVILFFLFLMWFD